MEEKIWQYAADKKSAVTIKQVVKALLISETQARRTLDQFVDQGKMTLAKQGGVRFYKVKE